LNGKIYIGGGMDVNRTPLNTLYVYDPGTNSYSTATPLPNTLTAPVVQYVNGKVFVTGGSAITGGAQNKSWLGTFV